MSVIDRMPVQMYRLTPKYGVMMREASNSSARIAPPEMKMRAKGMG